MAPALAIVWMVAGIPEKGNGLTPLGSVPLENREMSERKGIIFPLQFMGNVIPATGPRESNSWRPWLMLVNTIRMMQACQRNRDRTQIAKGQSER